MKSIDREVAEIRRMLNDPARQFRPEFIQRMIDLCNGAYDSRRCSQARHISELTSEPSRQQSTESQTLTGIALPQQLPI